MPPTTRGMTARGVVASEEYAVRKKRARKPTLIRKPRFRPKPSSAKTMHQEIGFDREELQGSGALESHKAESPTLTNDIHAIFDKERFDFDRGNPPAAWDEAYEAMKPAFRLVSRWITDPNFSTFWTALRFGHVEEDQSWPNSYALAIPDIEADHPADLTNELSMSFRALALDHRFRFRLLHHAWAETRSQSTPGYPNTVAPQFASTTILHDDFFYLSYTTVRRATKSQQLRFFFFYAVNLAHELAHLVWQYHWAREVNVNLDSVLDWEPFFYGNKDPFNELGIAWEQYMFGGRIQPLNHYPSPFVPDGLVILPMDMVRDLPFHDPLSRIAPLLTDWISDQFSETWWRKGGKKAIQARKPGHPRRSPVRATVNRTTDSNVFRTNTYFTARDSEFIEKHIVGGSPGHRLVHWEDDKWLSTGVVEFPWALDSEMSGSEGI